jgi:hypothetical protein
VDAKGETTPKKAKTVSSAEKAMVTAFWDSHEILLLDYLEKGKSKSGVYYGSSFDNLKAEIATKRPHLKKEKFCCTKTTPLFTPRQSLWPKFTNYSSN